MPYLNKKNMSKSRPSRRGPPALGKLALVFVLKSETEKHCPEIQNDRIDLVIPCDILQPYHLVCSAKS